MSTIYWTRRDFRLKDNFALERALSLGKPTLAIYIFAPEEEEPWGIGGASRWWLHHSLCKFEKNLKEKGLDLLILQGKPLPILNKLISATQAEHLVFNRLYEPSQRKMEDAVAKRVAARGCTVEGFSGDLLFEPGAVMNGRGKPYTVFTPFWKTALKETIEAPTTSLRGKFTKLKLLQKGMEIADLRLLPKIHWDKDFYAQWEPGEAGAWKRLKKFKSAILTKYKKGRDFPAEDWTSRLSAHLHFGEITARQLWHELHSHKNGDAYLREVGWREFARHLLFFFPHTPLHSLRKEFEKFPWKKSTALLRAWHKGKTGFPIVDAGMRQLWQTGWMHNRVRMIVGSFLVKDLQIPWQEGAKWFWDTLVDADLANNTLGWQWVGGCGADAAPYFRIFNPVLQGEKFDPNGDYVRRFVPELKALPVRWIHKPHLAPPQVLAKAGVVLGQNYPRPIVDHDAARQVALKLYSKFVKRYAK